MLKSSIFPATLCDASVRTSSLTSLTSHAACRPPNQSFERLDRKGWSAFANAIEPSTIRNGESVHALIACPQKESIPGQTTDGLQATKSTTLTNEPNICALIFPLLCMYLRHLRYVRRLRSLPRSGQICWCMLAGLICHFSRTLRRSVLLSIRVVHQIIVTR